MAALANVNGVISPPEEAKISVFDRGFLFGDGIYETGRTLDRCPLFWEEHLARLRRSAEKLLIKINWSDTEINLRLHATLKAFQKDNAYFRVIVTRGSSAKVGLDVPAESGSSLVIIVQDLPGNLAEKAKSGVRLITSKIVRNSAAAQNPNIKTSNYLNSLLALQDVRARGGEDAVLCDSFGNVTEGTTFSIFGVKTEGQLVTPSLEVGILDSITRRHVIALGGLKKKVEEGVFSREQFQNCPEIFIVSSVREIIPVAEWDGKKYPCPGPVTDALQQELKAEKSALMSRGIHAFESARSQFPVISTSLADKIDMS